MNLQEYNNKYHNGKVGYDHWNEISEELKNVAEKNDNESVKFLLISENIPINNLSELVVNALYIACRKNNVELAKYLCSSDDLKDINIPFYTIKDVVELSAEFGNLDIVKLFTDSKEVKPITHKHHYGEILIAAARNHSLEIIQYLLTTPELKNIVDVHYKDDMVFRYAISNEDTKIINFLIFDYNIPKTNDIEAYLRKGGNPIDADKLFEARDLRNNLNNDLVLNNIGTKKIKL